MKITTPFGNKGLITFINDHTQLYWVYFMNDKSEVENLFKNFYTMVENQFQAKIWVLRTKKGKEYFSNILGEYLLQNGIIS